MEINFRTTFSYFALQINPESVFVQIQRPKRWKEVIDSPSGSETKHFSHKEEFDQFYGTKASTKPKHTIDSDKYLDQVEQDDEDEETISIKTSKQDARELQEEQHTQYLNQMEKMHIEKIQKIDKFIELMSKK